MERGLRGRRSPAGGIADLAGIIAEHGGAVDYDLMTLTSFTLDDLGRALSWRALSHFVAHLPPTSALVREMHPEMGATLAWADGSMVAPLLADLIDSVAYGRWEYLASRVPKGKKRPRVPKRMPRPWEKAEVEKGERRVGSDPIPISEFDSWWESRGTG